MISNPSFRFARVASLVGLTALTVGSACVQDQELLIVDHAVWPLDANPGEACAFDPNGDEPAKMTVDVSYETEIGMAFAVFNRTLPNAGSNTGIDDSEIVIETADVVLSFSGGGLSTSSYEYQVPTNSIGGNETRAFLVTIPAEIVRSMRPAVPVGTAETEILEMEVTFRGRKAGQVGAGKLGEVKARPYTFPFEICNGCLRGCLADSECSATAVGLFCADDQLDWIGGTCGYAQGQAIYSSVCSAILN